MGSRRSFVKDLRASPLSEVPVGHPPRAGPGVMPSPARLTPSRSTCGAYSPRRCLTRGTTTCLRSTSDGYSQKFCHGPARLNPVRSTSGVPCPRRSRHQALTSAPHPAQNHLWGTLRAQVFDTRNDNLPQKYLWRVPGKVLSTFPPRSGVDDEINYFVDVLENSQPQKS